MSFVKKISRGKKSSMYADVANVVIRFWRRNEKDWKAETALVTGASRASGLL